MNGELPTPFASWLSAPPDGWSGADLGWLAARRDRARRQAAALGLPNRDQEAWRYTRIERLLDAGFVPAPPALPASDELEAIRIPNLDTIRIVLVNGRVIPALSALDDLPRGLKIQGLRTLLASDPDAVRSHLDLSVGAAPPLFAALNTAGLDDGLLVRLAPGTRLTQPLEIVQLALGRDAPWIAQPRHLILLGEGAEATLIERHLGWGESACCTNTVIELTLGPGARLRHERLQQDGPLACHLSSLHLRQAAESRYEGINIGLGAAWARTELLTRFDGEGAVCELSGLYLAGDRQLMDYHLDVDHAVPRCTSRETFKGILYGKGRAVFDGRVLVARHAQRSDAAMSNRNLLLSEQAEVDTKPQLEIHADDVRCSHGTTVGQLDPEQLFYLRARGLAAPLARRMLCLGFAGEIIDALGSAALREAVAGAVGQRLEDAPLDHREVAA